MSDDHGLRGAFASLRREEQARGPTLQRILARRAPARRVVLVPMFAAAAVLAIVALVLPQLRHEPRPAISLAEWTEPTAFLLNTPGRELLSGVPEFGRVAPVTNERSTSP